MKQTLILACCVFFGTTTFTLSDPATDASYIAEQHIISTKAEEKLDTLLTDVMAQMRPAFETLGAQIVDPDRFMDELMGDFEKTLISNIRKTSAAAYQELMTDVEIAALADYYRSDEGQVLLAQGLSEVTLNDYITFAQEGAGAPLLEHFPELLASMEEVGNETMARLGEIFTLNRMADLMEMEAIVKFEDEARRQAVVDAFRKTQ
ncbi:hypothetical protein [Ruegeria sp.]|uniref:hypothetical protein n=1 Tax=Ruegeria sp. TaxID=1879320 RepID=UPI003B5C15DA